MWGPTGDILYFLQLALLFALREMNAVRSRRSDLHLSLKNCVEIIIKSSFNYKLNCVPFRKIKLRGNLVFRSGRVRCRTKKIVCRKSTETWCR